MKRLRAMFYDNNGKLSYQTFARKIDITDLQTIIYLYCQPKYEDSEKYTTRLILSVKSTNIVDGVVTVYYVNDSYCVITRQK